MLHAAHRTPLLKRLSIRILLGIVSLFILLFIAAEIILATDIPKNLVVSLVQRQFGLSISAESLSTGLLGHTTLRNVTATLPLADKSFLSIPELTLDHTWLPGLVLGQSFSVSQITIKHPQLTVLQNPGGSWNVDEVVQLLARAGGSQNTQQASKNNDIPLLPNLDVTDASVVITDNHQKSATIEHLAITGRDHGQVVWDYNASVPDQLTLSGKLAPGGDWSHQIDLQIKNAQSWFSPWISSWPSAAQLQVRWTGRVDSGNLQGRIDVLNANYQSISAAGPFEFTSDGQTATLRPVGITVSPNPSHSLDTRLVGGTIVFNATGIQTQSLGLEFAQGKASVDARYAFADNSVSLHAAWRDVAFPSSALQSGDLQLDFASPLGQPRFGATLENDGAVKSGKWNALLTASGSGKDLRSLSLTLYAQKLRFDASSGKSLDLAGLTASIGAQPGQLVLQQFRVGHAHPIAGAGGYSFAKKIAWLSLDGHGWTLPGPVPSTLDLDLNLWANPQRVHLQQFYLATGMLTADMSGDYVYNLPKPVKVHADLSENPAYAYAESGPQPFRGLLRSSIDLNGTFAPLDLVLTGSAHGNHVHVGQRPLGNVNLNLEGYFRNDLVYVASKNIQLLGGMWNISGFWPAENGLFRIDELSVQHLSLPLAANSHNISGTLDGKWSIEIPELSLDDITVKGSATVHKLVIGNRESTTAKYLSFDEIQFPRTRLAYGNISLEPIHLTRTVGSAKGQADLSVFTSLDHIKHLQVGINAKAWPVLAAGAPEACLLSAGGTVDLDFARRTALGHLDLQADTSWHSQSAGQLKTAVDLAERTAAFTGIQITTLNGTATGQGAFDLDKPFASQLNLDWKNLDLGALAPLVKSLASLSGKTDGSLKIAPATTPRPLGPLAINLEVHSRNVQFKTLKIGDLQTAAFVGPGRIVLDDSADHPSQVALAGGIIRFWGRVAKHNGDVYQSLLRMTLDNLQLDTVVPAGAKSARAPGKLSGEITIIGRPQDPNLAMGEGSLTLADSDLAGVGPIAFLYNLMHLTHDANKPTGKGTIEFNIQDEKAYITAMRYFDKGTEIRINGDLADLLNVPHGPINLIAVGSVRPLSHLHIPGLADIDAALGAIQHDAISVQITGTLDHPQQKKIPFGDIGQDMKNFLFGDLLSTKE